MPKIKNFVVDTNVILYSPKALETFENNNIYMPAVVLEELDSFKKNVDLNGYNAREFIRRIEEYRMAGDLQKGIKLDSGGKLYIAFHDQESRSLIPDEFERKNDNLILSLAMKLKKSKRNETVVISKDVNLRLKANALGIKAEDYYHERRGSFLDNTNDELIVADSYLNELRNSHEMHLPAEIYGIDSEEFQPRANEYFILKSSENPGLSVYVKYIETPEGERYFQTLKMEETDNVYGIKPANRKQRYLLDTLLDPEIDIVFAIGIAGTGKTLLALCAGLNAVLSEGLYKRMVVTRSPIPMGRDLGYLPGGISEKLDPWLKPIYDNLEFIISRGNVSEGKDGVTHKNQLNNMTIEYLKDANLLEIEALTYIRGRTLMDTFVVIDEAQNLSPHEMKTIITRAGHNTKIVFTGDLKQIDNPYLTELDNGLINASEKFTSSKFAHCSTVYLDKGERSRLASEAAKVL
ncbi:PhoH family protein [Limisalsivibrio acetivorans]|uniref:PhoH family protein n=1 Tax=Limisalsivibrio acetivorans TaxID=1304888 RepID=UPI0003B7AD3F|nr:PhoH family protein [Limisalsivibrio acetivorans]